MAPVDRCPPPTAEIAVRDSSETGRRPTSGHSASAPDDAALVRDCLAAAPGAWDAFVARFAGLFRHVVDRTCSQHRLDLSGTERDDVVAEILVEILAGDAAVLRAFAGRSSLATYLAVVARRTAVRMTAGRTARTAQLDAAIEERAAPPDDERRRENRDEIEHLLRRLDPGEARLIRLHHLEGRSYGEISRLTGLPLGSIGPALSKARQKMRDAAPGAAGSADAPAAGGASEGQARRAGKSP